jgi:hypothetical protein
MLPIFKYLLEAVQININWVLYYISIKIKKKDNIFLMVRKISTVAALSLACLMSAVHSWKYQGHYLGKSDASQGFMSSLILR